jgi:chemotaxis regulatin CheY-phosphate phosphatase CheZ
VSNETRGAEIILAVRGVLNYVVKEVARIAARRRNEIEKRMKLVDETGRTIVELQRCWYPSITIRQLLQNLYGLQDMMNEIRDLFIIPRFPLCMRIGFRILFLPVCTSPAVDR